LISKEFLSESNGGGGRNRSALLLGDLFAQQVVFVDDVVVLRDAVPHVADGTRDDARHSLDGPEHRAENRTYE